MDMNFSDIFGNLYLMIEESHISKKIENGWQDSISFVDIEYADNNIDIINNAVLVSLKINEAKYLIDVLVNGYDFIKRWETPKLKFKVEYF